MKLNIEISFSFEEKTCAVIGLFEDDGLTKAAKKIDQHVHHAISKVIKQNLFQGKMGQILPLFCGDEKVEQIILIGCGKKKDFNATHFVKTIVNAMKALETHQITKATLFFSELAVNENESLFWKIRQMTEASWIGLYRFDEFKSKKLPASPLHSLKLYVEDEKDRALCEEALHQGQAIAEGARLTKNLGNTPSNICTPTFLAEKAKGLGKVYPTISVQVLEEKKMRELGMGALLAVAQGSVQAPKLIVLEYKGGGKSAPVALVGKGITFDTGGNSLKPPDSMVGMKYDMSGAGTVLGTFSAVAKLKLPINLVGIMAAVENMPGGSAYKPEDILVSMSGQTIEVISTDAEGRLILADALTYCERYKPDIVIDIATLTGAVLIALGFQATGLLANNDALAADLIRAGRESHDRVWQLPLWEEYQDLIKSPFADMVNAGGRWAGTITAGCFLSRFAKKFRWAHLDVAGTAAVMMGTSERMATGRPVPLLTQYLIDRCKH